MNNSSLIGVFLKDERKRLGLSQAEAAETCGVSREIWGKYERGLTMPGSEALYAFANFGADIQYVFTGIRSSLSLSAMEMLFLEKLRGCQPSVQDRALRILLGEQSTTSITTSVHAENVDNQIGTNTAPITINKRGKK